MKLEISNIEGPGGEYEDDRMYFTVNNLFDVKVVKTDEGIVIDVYTYGVGNDPLATTYAFDVDARAEQTEADEADDGERDESVGGMTDAEADADVLASAGMGTDEDYGYFGGDDGY